jgi:predicted N-formylglutamate amidohydrolase
MSPLATRSRPFHLVRPDSLSPVLLTCEHAAAALPPPVRAAGAARAVLRTHWGFDIGGWDVTRALARRLGATAVGGRWSRLWIDLNRRAGDPTLIRSVAEGVPLPWNRDLAPEDVERRLVACHAPYHAELERQILRRLVRGVRPLLLAVHTFTAIYEGRARPFDVGILYDREADLARRLGRALGRDGFSVRHNEPYSGKAGLMYSVDRHATHHGLPCLEIELNQRAFTRRGAAERLGRALAPRVAELVLAR